MKALLDTNIIIHRETNRIFNENIGTLFLWLDKLGYEKFIHNLTIDEIKKHKDEKIRATMLAKMSSYQVLEMSLPLNEEVEKVSKKIDVTENDKIDTKILNELYCGRVDLLITEDVKLYKKAIELGIANKVKSINGFLEWVLTENPGLTDYKIKNIRKEKFGAITLSQNFFNSLRRDYPEFDKWYLGNYDKEAYVCGDNDNITAFLSLKTEFPGKEDYSNIKPTFLPKKRLKIRTFKVIANGYKIGERFLKITFDNALANNVEEIYVTLFPEDEARETLVSLLTTFGFIKWGMKDEKEEVYVRVLDKHVNKENPLKTYPFYDKNSSVYMITINEKYHTSLFPDSIVRNEKPEDFEENKGYANAIRKYYLTRAYSNKPQVGDILLFCRTAGSRFKSVITTIGVVCGYKDKFINFSDFYNQCFRRCALTEKEMKEMWYRNLTYCPKAIDFVYIESLPKKINIDDLTKIGFDVNEMPKGIIKISHEMFEKIISTCKANKKRIKEEE